MARSVVVSGGGVKSAVAAARIAADHELILVHVDFGQRAAAAECDALARLAQSFPAARVIKLALPHVKQLDQQASAPEGARVNDTNGPVSVSPATRRGLVPVLLSVAVQCAQRMGASSVLTGLSRLCDASQLGLVGSDATAGDLRAYLHALNLGLEALPSPGPRIRVDAPLIDLTYAQIVKLGQRLEVPMKSTWSCEQSCPQPCGRCGACRARAAAFSEATLVDPLVARSRTATRS